MSTKTKQTFLRLVAVISILAINLFYLPVHAASLSSISDTLSRIKTSTTANHTIVFTTPSGIQNGDTVTFTFPSSSFTMGASLTGVTIGGNAVTSASWSAPTLTITASATSIVAPAGTATIVIPSTQITNPSSADTYIVSIAGTFGDTGAFAIAITADDQFTVSASVEPSITFTLNDTTVDLGVLSVSTVKADTTNFTVNTNAGSGYSVTAVEDGNLRTTTADINDVADGTVTAGSEEYGMSTSKAGQTFTQTSGNAATAITGTAQQCASATAPASSDVTTLTLHASVAGATPAGSYSHTVTLIATGNF